MSKLNLLVSLNSYADGSASNNPARSHFKWTRELNAHPVGDEPESRGHKVAPGETRTLYNTLITVGLDGTSQWSLAAKGVNYPNIYVLTNTGGQAPDFTALFKGQTVFLKAGFMTVNRGAYEITTVVSATVLEFASTATLTPEASVTTDQILFYSAALSLIYVESDKLATLSINGSDAAKIETVVNGTTVTPGMLLNKRTVYSLTLKNESTETATVYFAGVE